MTGVILAKDGQAFGEGVALFNVAGIKLEGGTSQSKFC